MITTECMYTYKCLSCIIILNQYTELQKFSVATILGFTVCLQYM